MKKQYLQDDNTIDVISPELVQEYSLFFAPIGVSIEIGPNVLVQNFSSTADLLVFLELAPSKSWCRKNNWDRPIETGYSEIVFGSLRYKICILR